MLVRVYNKNVHPFSQMWQDGVISIEPGEYRVMEEGEAVRFVGSFTHPKKLGTGGFDPRSFKMLEIMPHTVQEVKPMAQEPQFVCHFDGKKFSTQEELDAWIDANHLDKLHDQELADKRRKTKKG